MLPLVAPFLIAVVGFSSSVFILISSSGVLTSYYSLTHIVEWVMNSVIEVDHLLEVALLITTIFEVTSLSSKYGKKGIEAPTAKAKSEIRNY